MASGERREGGRERELMRDEGGRKSTDEERGGQWRVSRMTGGFG